MQYKHPICQKYFVHTEMEINTQAHFFHLPTPFIRKLLENVLYQKKWGFESNKYLHGVQDPTQDRIRRNPERNSNGDPGQENTEFTLLEETSGVNSSRRQTSHLTPNVPEDFEKRFM